MKKFDILRYLRRFFALVLAVTMAGTVVVYWYCKNNQTYTASVNIKYLHDGIKDGFAPDGTAMNVDETTLIEPAPETQHLPIPRATTAA